MIIGLVGFFCSGKDTFARYLEKKGFIHFSLSDILRKELELKRIEKTRENLQKIGDELRKTYGPGVLAKKLANKLKENEDYVISSIRHPSEVLELKKNNNFFLVYIKCKSKIRFERGLKRKMSKDILDYKEFVKAEKRETGKGSQDILGVIKMADFVITNESTIEEFYKKIDKLLDDINLKLVIKLRPSKDLYYLNIAKAISQRSTCLNVKIGAIIVKEDQIIATGYVGAPRKTLSCIERGFCLRRKLKIPSGKRYELCRSVHAEQNAIINSARAGVSLLNGTMYIWGMKIYQGQRKIIKAVPCFICKKMIINSGLKRVVITDGKKIISFNVKKWIREWQEKDMLDDKEVYNAGY